MAARIINEITRKNEAAFINGSTPEGPRTGAALSLSGYPHRLPPHKSCPPPTNSYPYSHETVRGHGLSRRRHLPSVPGHARADADVSGVRRSSRRRRRGAEEGGRGRGQGPAQQGERARAARADADRVRGARVPADPRAGAQVGRADHRVAAPAGRALDPGGHGVRHHPRRLLLLLRAVHLRGQRRCRRRCLPPAPREAPARGARAGGGGGSGAGAVLGHPAGAARGGGVGALAGAGGGGAGVRVGGGAGTPPQPALRALRRREAVGGGVPVTRRALLLRNRMRRRVVRWHAACVSFPCISGGGGGGLGVFSLGVCGVREECGELDKEDPEREIGSGPG
jgi:hypothetical protein